MFFSELPDPLKAAFDGAAFGTFQFDPKVDPSAKPPSTYVPLVRSLPHGLLSTGRPISPGFLGERLFSEISGGHGFAALKEKIVYPHFSDADLLSEPNWPISREQSFYYVSQGFMSWVVDKEHFPILQELGIALSEMTAPVFEQGSEPECGAIAYLVDFPLADVIDYSLTRCNWTITPPPKSGPFSTERAIYFPGPELYGVGVTTRATSTLPIVRDRHARTCTFIRREILGELQQRGIKGPDYSLLSWS